MALTALDGTPLVMLGSGARIDGNLLAISTPHTLDVTAEASISYGRIFTEDGGSHTIDTTGSSSLGWRASTVTFANVGSVLTVGLAPVDLTAGPPGRASNTAGVINFDVAKVYSAASGPTTLAWNESVPSTGTKTIANGDFVAFAIQMTTRAGADAVNVQLEATGSNILRPGVTGFDGTSTYTAAANFPNLVITFSDGTLGFFYGGCVTSATPSQTWNSGSATKEYGNYLLAPVPWKVYGMYAGGLTAANDFELVLYSDPFGTPVAERTISVDANSVSSASAARGIFELFAAPYTTTASQPLGAIFKPGAANLVALYRSLFLSAHQKEMTLGANGYAINRASGAFAAQNSNKDRFAIGLLVGAFDNATGGASTGISRARAFSGFA